MKANFHEQLDDQAAVALPPDRSTGLVLASAAAVAAVLLRGDPPFALAAVAAAALLAGLSLAAPAMLRPLNVAWMGLARLLGRIASPIVMLVLFCITIVPFGIAMQLRTDPLRRRPTGSDETFWIVPEIEFGPGDLTRQF